MNARTEFQIIVGQDGKPAFVVVPYEQFRRMKGGFTHGTVPNEVVTWPSSAASRPWQLGVSTSASHRRRSQAVSAFPRRRMHRWSVSSSRAKQRLKRWRQPLGSRRNICAGRYTRLAANPSVEAMPHGGLPWLASVSSSAPLVTLHLDR